MDAELGRLLLQLDPESNAGREQDEAVDISEGMSLARPELRLRYHCSISQETDDDTAVQRLGDALRELGDPLSYDEFGESIMDTPTQTLREHQSWLCRRNGHSRLIVTLIDKGWFAIGVELQSRYDINNILSHHQVEDKTFVAQASFVTQRLNYGTGIDVDVCHLPEAAGIYVVLRIRIDADTIDDAAFNNAAKVAHLLDHANSKTGEAYHAMGLERGSGEAWQPPSFHFKTIPPALAEIMAQARKKTFEAELPAPSPIPEPSLTCNPADVDALKAKFHADFDTLVREFPQGYVVLHGNEKAGGVSMEPFYTSDEAHAFKDKLDPSTAAIVGSLSTTSIRPYKCENSSGHGALK